MDAELVGRLRCGWRGLNSLFAIAFWRGVLRVGSVGVAGLVMWSRDVRRSLFGGLVWDVGYVGQVRGEG